MSPPLPEQPLSVEEAINQLVILLSAANLAAVVHLSKTKSVNLRHVARYEMIEQFEEKETGEGKTKTVEQVPFEPPRFVPALFFGGNTEGDYLSDEENSVFRPAWQRHALMTGRAYGILEGIFGQGGVVSDGDQQL